MEIIDFSNAIEMVSCTDSGRVRSHNEDSVLVIPQFGLAVLADGMGGYNAGEVASGMATTVLGSELMNAFRQRSPHEVNVNGLTFVHEVLVDVVGRTNAAIHTAAATHSKYAGMGTTLVMVQFFDNRLAVAHVGDSRLYRLRGDMLTRLTRDHSLLQEQIDSGMITPEQARYSMNKNLVTRGLGVEMTVDTEVNEYEALPGDIYLLCSDGLNDMVEDDEIAATMSALSSNLPMCATQLVQKANDNGGRDNVSVILARIKEPFPALNASGGWKGHLKSWFK